MIKEYITEGKIVPMEVTVKVSAEVRDEWCRYADND